MGCSAGSGLKVGPISRGRFEARIRELVAGQPMLETMSDAMPSARAALGDEFKRLHRALLAIVRDDPVCRQLMSVPGVGAMVAITFKSGVDDPTRFKRSRDVGPHFGLSALPRSRRWDGEVGEAAMSEVAVGSAHRLRWKDGLTASTDRIEWQHQLTTDRRSDQRQDKTGELDSTAHYRRLR